MRLLLDIKDNTVVDVKDSNNVNIREILLILPEKADKKYFTDGEEGVVNIALDVVDTQRLYDIEFDSKVTRVDSVHKTLIKAVCSVLRSVPAGWYAPSVEYNKYEDCYYMEAFNDMEDKHTIMLKTMEVL